MEKTFMPIELPTPPYAADALAPHMSRATLQLHHGKHHKAYVEATNSLIAGTALAKMSLEDIIRATASRKAQSNVFNNAAQAWNHEFYWNSMTPTGGGSPTGDIRSQIERDFKSVEAFAKAFHAAALHHFGSGWAWLLLDPGGLVVFTSQNGDTPLAHGRVPILTLDLWEHAYYLDYQNRRSDYIANFLSSLVNWEFANTNLNQAQSPKVAAE